MNRYKELKIEIILLLIAFLWVLFSYFISFTDSQGSWFARSGAIMVLLAVIVEFRFNNEVVRKISSTIQIAVKMKLPVGVGIQKEKIYISRTAHAFVIVGTLIWGYGDLIK